MSDRLNTTSPFHDRLERIQGSLSSSEIGSIVLNPGPSLFYLTGLNFHLMERPVVAIIPSKGPPVMILPELEQAKLEKLPFPALPFSYGEDPAGWQMVFDRACQSANIEGKTVGVEPGRLRFLELRLLETSAAGATFVSAEEILATLRDRKEGSEISAIRSAVRIAQQALEATLSCVKAGATEREIASELTVRLYQAGSDVELPFSPIVSGGPNSANPHAAPGDRALLPGDLLVIDWGATYSGYISDLTRTFAISEIEAEFTRIANVVALANKAGREAARPGVTAGAVDLAARRIIEEAGYGPYFTHRTGHGIGMEAHEPPYIRAGSLQLLQPGMTFTVEPGIYLPGRGGVRIEDNIMITADGSECLSKLEREIRVLG